MLRRRLRRKKKAPEVSYELKHQNVYLFISVNVSEVETVMDEENVN